MRGAAHVCHVKCVSAIELEENIKPQIIFIVSESWFVFLHTNLCLVQRISVF